MMGLKEIEQKMINRTQKLKIILDKYKLSEKDKSLWYFFALKTSTRIFDTVLEFLEEKPEMIKLLTENLKSKLEIFKTNNEDAWKKLMEEEKGVVEKL